MIAGPATVFGADTVSRLSGVVPVEKWRGPTVRLGPIRARASSPFNAPPYNIVVIIRVNPDTSPEGYQPESDCEGATSRFECGPPAPRR